MKNKPLFSIIIPVRVKTSYLLETLSQLKNQSFTSFEVLVITDQISQSPNPAIKRNLGTKMSRGTFLAFIDDDSYPDKDWLKNLDQLFTAHPEISALCGPSLTPSTDNIFQKASGLVWSSWLGSGGAGTYRNTISQPRLVDDYPSVNLTIKKDDFNQVGGFNTSHWPGEDTLLCHDLVYKQQKKIYYHPSIIVYHHRRQVIIAHLKQITRYALHRGHFARIFPKNSFKIGYFIPSIFTLYLICLFPLLSIFKLNLILFPLFAYLLLLCFTFLTFIKQKQAFKLSLLATINIPLTHIYYGILFLVGFFSRNLDFTPHQTNEKGYIGG